MRDFTLRWLAMRGRHASAAPVGLGGRSNGVQFVRDLAGNGGVEWEIADHDDPSDVRDHGTVTATDTLCALSLHVAVHAPCAIGVIVVVG